MAQEIKSAEEFKQEVLNSDKPVLVDFFATWCGPCKMLSPIVEEIAVENADKIKVVKVDTDELSSVASAYGIMSIPTLILFKEGEAVDQRIGVRPKSDIEAMIA